MTRFQEELGPPLRPVFVTGAPRSGTTLCAQMLNAHSRLTIFDEINLLELCDFYERLHHCADFDVAAISLNPEAPIMKLISRKIKRRQLTDTLKNETCYNFVRTLLPKRRSIEIWGEKAPAYVAKLGRLKSLFPDSAIIFMVRHPNALIASYLRYRNAQERTKDDFWIADSPHEAIGRLEEIAEHFVANRQLFRVLRYEDFVAEPKRAAIMLCNALRIEFEEGMLQYQPGELPGSRAARQFWRSEKLLAWKAANLKRIDASVANLWKEDALTKRLANSEIERIVQLERSFEYLSSK